MRRPVTVVGGGIAGLATATALSRRGASVRVLERAPEISEVGAGLQISPNGLKVIDALGLGSGLRAVSAPARAVVLRTEAGDAVARLPLDDGRHGDYLFVHRARLIGVLEEGARAEGAEIVTGHPVETAPEGLVIAADGLHSVIRPRVNGRTDPFFTGQVAWRAIVPDPAPDADAQVFMGAGRHLVSYSLGEGLRNIVAIEERNEWVAEGWNRPDDPANLRAAFARFGGPVPKWLEAVEAVNAWGLFRHPVASRWHTDRIALVGDAAHPTLPFLAQGANLALEDAWTVAACLDRAAPEKALARYQALRKSRADRVIAAANANARNYHLAPGPARFAAHTALRGASALAPTLLLRRFDWIYGYDATAH